VADATPRFGWGHININVKDLDRSIAFYRKLGFEIFIPGIPYLALEAGPEAQPVPDDGAAALGIAQGTRGRACIMQLDDGFPKIDLTEFADQKQAAPLANGDLGLVRICLITEDLPGEVARLKAEGVEFLSEPKAGHMELADVAVCKDPDGTLIELLQVYLERWQALLGGE
jgi:catechol 2,3-dioxygenase-like lactoylglutathione lyase family enzyme